MLTAFTLTADQDTLTGTANDDTFTAGVINVNNTLNDSLQAVDALNGGDGSDTLTATMNAGAVITPSMSNIENVTVRSTADGSGIDLSAASGVEKVTVENSTATAVVEGLGSVASLAVNNQNKDVSFDDSTATTLGLSVDTVGKVSKTAAVEVAVDLGATVASKATALNLTVNASNIEVKDTAGTNVATSATIAATGANEVKLTNGAASLTTLSVSGTGSVDVSETALTKLKTLTATDAGVTVDATGGVLETATTGAGKDDITVVGATVKSINTGAGDDKVTSVTTGLAATSTVDLGAGDDTLALGNASAAGAVLTAGEGTDTLAAAHADYATISGYSTANKAKITGFERLNITDVLANTDVVDLSAIGGLVSAQIAGTANTGAASVTNVGANSTVTIKGNMVAGQADGAVAISLKDSTGAADVLNLTIDQAITQNNDATVDTATSAITGITTTGVETVNVTSTGTLSTAVTAGAKTDAAVNGLVMVNNDLEVLNISGDQGLTFSSAAGMVDLKTVNASANTAGVTVNVSAAATDGSAEDITITGSAGDDTVVGSGNVDTISGGAGADTITGGAKADVLSGGAGNDIFVIAAATDSTLVNLDVISDFSANTAGQGTNGAADENGATATVADRTGDIIDLSFATPAVLELSVQSNASDAQTFLQNASTDATLAAVNVALDSSSGNLYIDADNNGTVDTVIQLNGVTTITEAAFII
ncbi:calcium-binding protein [Pontibacterium sp. N1Y112]|uniref:Calcium-binding protein n=1 Tax=Pontibacterium sinense TaxID=2781979 RepID=A0A8J7K4S2_9GAMM|nr:calcium-binding protein [Pontibacterium sinense]MBE9395945.1 calcium-binding protein [Pontibacterium sinense]